MRVIAFALGFYQDSRRRVGDEFDMDPRDMKNGGEGIRFLPDWVRAATDQNRAVLAARQKQDEAKHLAATKAANGPKRNSQTFNELMHGPRGPQQRAPNAAAAALAASGTATAHVKKNALKAAEGGA